MCSSTQSLSGCTYLDNVSSVFASRPNKAHEIKREDDAYKHQHGVPFLEFCKCGGPNGVRFHIKGAEKRGVVALALRCLDRGLFPNLGK